jgi:hypothetical protein
LPSVDGRNLSVVDFGRSSGTIALAHAQLGMTGPSMSSRHGVSPAIAAATTASLYARCGKYSTFTRYLFCDALNSLITLSVTLISFGLPAAWLHIFTSVRPSEEPPQPTTSDSASSAAKRHALLIARPSAAGCGPRGRRA